MVSSSLSGLDTTHSKNGATKSRSRHICNHCKRLGRGEFECWTKHPHLNPPTMKLRDSKSAFIANESEGDPVSFQMAKSEHLKAP